MPALGFTRVDVTEVHLNERQGDPGQRVAQRQTRMCPRAGVHERGIDPIPQGWRDAGSAWPPAERVNGVEAIPFVIELGTHQLHPELTRHDRQARFDLGKRRIAVDLWLSCAEQVEVGTIEHGNAHQDSPRGWM